jgi:hypothetical protein
LIYALAEDASQELVEDDVVALKISERIDRLLLRSGNDSRLKSFHRRVLRFRRIVGA